MYAARTRSMSDGGQEDKINTRLRELTEEVRKLREELRGALRRGARPQPPGTPYRDRSRTEPPKPS